MEATGALPVSRGSEDTERLPVQVLKTQADKWTQGASMLSFSGISLKKSKREKEKKKKKNTWGDQLLWARPIILFFKMDFYTLICT